MAIHLKVKFFVPFDRLMGKTEFFQVDDGTTIKKLFTILAAKYPGFGQASLKGQWVILLNGAICTPEGKLAEGDTISILAPQLGG